MTQYHIEVYNSHNGADVGQYLITVPTKSDFFQELKEIGKRYLRSGFDVRVFHVYKEKDRLKFVQQGTLWKEGYKIFWGSGNKGFYNILNSKYEPIHNNWEEYNAKRKAEYLASQGRRS